MHIYPNKSRDWLVQGLKRLNFGCYCSLCARPANNEMDLCISCRQLLKSALLTDRSGQTTQLCAYCGNETTACPANTLRTLSMTHECAESALTAQWADAASGGTCSNCTNHDPLFQTIVAPYRYLHPVDGMIKRLKYRQDRQLARVLGGLLAAAVTQHLSARLPELLIPMPLHPARQSVRGFNQAHDIACWTGRQLQVPVAAQLVSRVVNTESLAGLNRHERQYRILGAFRAEDALHGRRVAIVDDVLTTGASARELAREIYDSGAESVELWVLARTSSLRSSL